MTAEVNMTAEYHMRCHSSSLGQIAFSVDLCKVDPKLMLDARCGDLQHPGGWIQLPLDLRDPLHRLHHRVLLRSKYCIVRTNARSAYCLVHDL